MANEKDERNEAVLAMKELNRQITAMISRHGDETLNVGDTDWGRRLLAQIEDLREGRISPDDAMAEQETIEEELEKAIEATGDPQLVTAHRSDTEARLKGMPQTVQLLAHNSAMRAADGISREQWITEVLQGHEGDDSAQLGCLKHIVTLWTDGPWPWPAERMPSE